MDYQRSKIVWFVKNLKESRGRKANMCGVDKLDVTGATEYLCVCSVAKFCATLCNPMDCSMPGFPVHHQLPELAQTHVHQVSDAIQPILASVVPFSSYLQSFPASGSFPMSHCSHQVTKAAASASVLPMNILG